MIVNLNNIDFSDQPILILKNASETPLGVLGYSQNVSLDICFNEISAIEFVIPSKANECEVPHYSDVCGTRIIELRNIAQFVLINPNETDDGVHKYKKCKGYSLEFEFTFKKISLPYDTYNFWNPSSPDNTLLGIIMSYMPSWSVGFVPESLINRFRTYEVSNDNLYNFMKGTIQKSYDCIFTFDTLNRIVNVWDVSADADTAPVYMSTENLVKEIQLAEDTENIVTRLDVNGAEGVDIRDVNPDGTNRIINLDYFMTPLNFSEAIISKYNAWKSAYKDSQKEYYSLSINYSLRVAEKITAEAQLTDLNGELSALEAEQGVTIQAIAQGLKTQADLDDVNQRIDSKKAEIVIQNEYVETLREEVTSILTELASINSRVNFKAAFTEDEYLIIDRYIHDDDISESSFVVTESQSFDEKPVGSVLYNSDLMITSSDITSSKASSGSEILSINGGDIALGDTLQASIIAAVIEIRTDGTLITSARLGSGRHNGNEFISASYSLTCSGELISSDIVIDSESDLPHGTHVQLYLDDGFSYFTREISDFEKKSVAWDLFRFGEQALAKMSQPSYTFDITSANFFSAEKFEEFKKNIELGKKIYVPINDRILSPICIGLKLEYDNPENLELKFSDSYLSNDSAFRLVDLLEKSVSAGKNVELSKYVYSAFADSGAQSSIHSFMNSSLDVSKNNIFSSGSQAVTWDQSGVRLRKWIDDSHTTYEKEELWLINNSIVMTNDSWRTAQMAIGKFVDENLGECWGIVAPRIVGTLIAGSELIIESSKKEGGQSVFRVDSEGVRLYNGDLSIQSNGNQILLNPDVGFMIGTYPLLDGTSGEPIAANTKMWIDSLGNIHMKGAITATSLSILSEGSELTVDDYINGSQVVKKASEDAQSAIDLVSGIHNGTTGIDFKNSNVGSVLINTEVGVKVVGSDNTYFQVMNNAMGFFREDSSPMLYYEDGNMVLTGTIFADAGYIGGEDGWIIGSDCIFNNGANAIGSPNGVYLGADGVSIGAAIVLKPDGTFIIRNNNEMTGTEADESNYVLRVSPETVDGVTVYTMFLSNVSFDENFVLPTKHGGTGGTTKAALANFGVYRVMKQAELDSIPDADNGDLAIMYSDGEEGAILRGSILTTPQSAPGYMAIAPYGTTGHTGIKRFDLKGVVYWNVNSLSGDSVSTDYARVGVGTTVSAAAGLFMPLSVTLENTNTPINTAVINFTLNTRPSGATRDVIRTWERGIYVAMYKAEEDGSLTRIASTTYNMPSSWQTAVNEDRAASVTLTCDGTGITNGEYYVVFYNTNDRSLIYIKGASVSIPESQVGASVGLFLRTGGIWRSLLGG